jgi:hypothetical protein
MEREFPGTPARMNQDEKPLKRLALNCFGNTTGLKAGVNQIRRDPVRIATECVVEQNMECAATSFLINTGI